MFGLPQIGKQRVESVQILKAILGEKSLNGKPYKGWLTTQQL